MKRELKCFATSVFKKSYDASDLFNVLFVSWEVALLLHVLNSIFLEWYRYFKNILKNSFVYIFQCNHILFLQCNYNIHMRLLVPSLKKPRTHFTSHKLIHKSILYCYAYNSTWKTVFCILTEFIFYGKLSRTSAWLFRAVCEWFFLSCWRVRPIEKLVRTGSSRLQASQFLRTIDYNQFSKEIEEKILCIICTPPLVCGLCGKAYFYCN